MRLGEFLGRLPLALTLAIGLAAPQAGIGDDSGDARPCIKAFLVGTDEYELPGNDLGGCVNDVDAFTEVLNSLDVELTVVTLTSRAGPDPSPKAGKKEIEKGFKDFLKDLKPEDIAIVMFSGHGCQIKDESTGKYRTYYAPRDMKKDNERKNKVETLIDLSDIVERFSRNDAKFKWAIVDACRNTPNEASTTRDLSVSQRKWQVEVVDTTAGLGENFFLSQSCAAKQESAEYTVETSGVKRGAYMLSLCEALEDEQKSEHNGNTRVVSIERACNDAKEVVKKYNPIQTPTNTESQNSYIAKFPVKSRLTAKIGDVDVEFVWIPQGTFDMGDSERKPIPDSRPNERPAIKVKITRGYWLARTETTNKLWSQVMGEDLEEGLDPQKPVVGKTWDECKRFIDKLNENEAFLRQFSPGESAAVFEASLPTEAQWERACRAEQEGAVTQEIAGELRKVGKNESDVNSWGLRDMFGNVREWCVDCYEDYSDVLEEERNNREGWRDTGLRVVRGGGFAKPGVARATQREGVYTDKAPADVGFRIALVRKNP